MTDPQRWIFAKSGIPKFTRSLRSVGTDFLAHSSATERVAALDIVPTAVIYQNRLLENLRGLRETFSPEEYELLGSDRRELVKEIQLHIIDIKRLVREMTEARRIANHKASQVEKAYSYQESVCPYMEMIREHIDHLELEIDDEIWPLPKYRELLFAK